MGRISPDLFPEARTQHCGLREAGADEREQGCGRGESEESLQHLWTLKEMSCTGTVLQSNRIKLKQQLLKVAATIERERQGGEEGQLMHFVLQKETLSLADDAPPKSTHQRLWPAVESLDRRGPRPHLGAKGYCV